MMLPTMQFMRWCNRVCLAAGFTVGAGAGPWEENRPHVVAPPEAQMPLLCILEIHQDSAC